MPIEVARTGDLTEAVAVEAPRPDTLPVLPLRDLVAYPDTLTPLAIGQERSMRLVNEIMSGERQLVLLTARDPEPDEPEPDGLYTVGVAGSVARMLRVPDGTIRIVVQVTERVRITDWVAEEPYLMAKIEASPDEVSESQELEALTRNVQRSFSEIIEEIPYLPEELQLAVTNIDDPSALSHLIAGSLRIATSEKQELLEEVDVTKRLRRLSEVLAREVEVIQLGSKIQSQVQSEIDKGQREFVLREQMKAIQSELDEENPDQAEVAELRERIEAADLPEHAAKAAERELSRLERLPAAAAEYGVIRTYLEWMVELPWSQATEDNLDIANAREVLDEDHYDLENVKDRILEYLAVRSLNPQSHGPILCFAGPPGVGKTSLGQSIARALGREFERISVGGVRDEAEIRGHRRTYIGAMPGTIIRALRDAGSLNPVFMIDEIDKMGSDFRGDPSSAMLEVLDPAQNGSFRDHYLDLGFDLSGVLFIATANTLDTIPGPLRDRMEVIQLSGYTLEEKVHIAKRYLVPRQILENGLTGGQIAFADPALRAIADEYTREAGVRNLEREVGTVCRKIARDVAERKGKRGPKVTISAKRVRELLGRQRYFAETRRRTADPGVATGLAWTPVGGDVLFIEATAMTGTGKLTITGQLGDVMRESAQAALSFVRGHS
ncbi:MAG: endopeptidase La, partial [Solirubrobacterales bacterium]